MKNRIWLGLALTVAAGFMLNACGGGNSNSAAVAPVGITPAGVCPAGINGYSGTGYPGTGYLPGGYVPPTYGYPTTGYYGNTGMNYNYGYAGNSYWYTYSYGNGGINPWNAPGYGNPGFGNIPGTGYPNQLGYMNGYNGYNTAYNPALSGCTTAGYPAGGLCMAQQTCTNMGQPGLVHYGSACYPSCGACMASVNGQCLPGM